MGQKVNPISLRLQKTNRHFDSCWYDDYNYTHLLLQDLKIKNYLKTVLNQISYPEGRLLILYLPKKNNINIFYYNPSNSRRKKSIRFQLQNYKDNKKNSKQTKPSSKRFQKFGKDPEQKYITLAQQGLEEWKKSLIEHSFPYKNPVFVSAFETLKYYFPIFPDSIGNHKYYGDKAFGDTYRNRRFVKIINKPSFLNILFPLQIVDFYKVYPFQKTKQKTLIFPISMKTLKKEKKDINDDGLLLTKKEFLLNPIAKIANSNIFASNKEDFSKFSFTKKYLSLQSKTIIHNQIVMPTKENNAKENLEQNEDYYQKNSLSIFFPLLESDQRFLSEREFSYKEKVQNNINGKLLEFVIKRKAPNRLGETLKYKEDHNKWVTERFFVRYLFAQFYCKFLQNKKAYHTENYTTLYKFLVFFQEKNLKNSAFLKKYKNYKENNKIIPTNHLTGLKSQSNKNAFALTGVGKGSQHFLPKANKNVFALTGVKSALYSSKYVYKSHLELFLSKEYNTFFNLHLFRSLIEKQGASFLVEEIIYYLERKIPFRRIKTQILKEIPQYKPIKGIRMNCSGRVGGRSKKAQRSKTQSVKIGQTSLGVFSSKIDFAYKSAYTRFGLIGVKVWVCYQ